MGQGHCVAAIDALNVLLGNLNPEQSARYGGAGGLDHLVTDFYSYRQQADGRTEAPLGSHVNPFTAGGIMEGGYLGFAELQYVHMPLPGKAWWRSCRMARRRNSVAATGPRAGGGPKTAACHCR